MNLIHLPKAECIFDYDEIQSIEVFPTYTMYYPGAEKEPSISNKDDRIPLIIYFKNKERGLVVYNYTLSELLEILLRSRALTGYV